MTNVFVILLWALLVPVTGASAETPFNVDEEELITMNVKDADIRVLAKFISELTHKNFVVDDKVQGKVTIISPEKVTISEAYNVFESILEVKGFTLIPTGKIIKIVPLVEAKHKGIETMMGKVPVTAKGKDEFATQILHLNYINAEEIGAIIRPLFSRNGHLVAYSQTNTLIMTDLKSNLYRVSRVISALDVKGYQADLYLIPLRNASAKSVANHLEQILGRKSSPAAGPAPSIGPVSREIAPAVVGQNPVPTLAASSVPTGTTVSSGVRIIPDERTNSLIILATPAEYRTISGLVRKLDVETPEGTGKINLYYLQNAVAEELVSVVSEFITGVKAAQGTDGAGAMLPNETEIKIVADKGTNALIVNADLDDYEQIRELLDKLDIPRSQVLIEALFMEVRGSDSINLGVEWQAFGADVGTDGSIDKLGFGGSLTNSGRLSDVTGAINDENAEQLARSLGNGFNLGVFGNFIEIDGLQLPSISALVTAVSTRADTNILATPQILTIDNQEAEIKIGENRPFVTQARTGEQGVNDVFQSFDFRDVGLTLKVTPHISHNRFVRLELFQEISRVNEEATTGPGGTGATAPVTTKRSAQTSVVVQDGHTIVIGGLIEDNGSSTETQVPCLGDLPFLGTLFRSTGNSMGKTNLMIFLTPHIITNPMEAATISEDKHKEFEAFERYESKEPEPTFYGPQQEENSSPADDSNLTGTGTEENTLDRNQEYPEGTESPATDETTGDLAGRPVAAVAKEEKKETGGPEAIEPLPESPVGMSAHLERQPDPLVPTAMPRSPEIVETFIPPADEEQVVDTPEPTITALTDETSMHTGRYRVRTAVFFNTRALEREKERLLELGYAPYITTRTIMRNRETVRIGPLPGLSDYMLVLRDAEKKNLSVVKIEDGSELFAHVTSSGRDEQLAAFADHWEKEGFETAAITKGIPREIHWLMAGAYDTWEDAELTRKSLLADGIEAMIIESPRQ